MIWYELISLVAQASRLGGTGKSLVFPGHGVWGANAHGPR